MSQKNETTVLVLSLAVTLLLVTAGLWLAKSTIWTTGQNSQEPQITPEQAATNQPIPDRISSGEKLLIPADATSEKRAGIEAIAAGNYEDAVSKLEAAFKSNRNDPETLIALNNARIGNQKSYTIAASVPIGSDVNAAKEILRGVAQAQNETNQGGGIKGIPLKVTIVNDDNDPNVAKQVAATLVKTSAVLGVVGHYASDVTLATANTYQSGQLLAISPISTSVKLSGVSRYVFRTVPSDYVAARALADYMLQKLKQQKVAVFYNSRGFVGIRLFR